jgi:hypothetical protein
MFTTRIIRTVQAMASEEKRVGVGRGRGHHNCQFQNDYSVFLRHDLEVTAYIESHIFKLKDTC